MNATPNQRILLAEDDDAMRVYLERALVNAGYAVDAVDRGTEALPLLKETGYDLLLSDIVLCLSAFCCSRRTSPWRASLLPLLLSFLFSDVVL